MELEVKEEWGGVPGLDVAEKPKYTRDDRR
jgi:hypothetical protein